MNFRFIILQQHWSLISILWLQQQCWLPKTCHWSVIMEIKAITDRFAVAGQIQPSNLQAIKDWGAKLLINNRPDGEPGCNVSSSAIEAASKDHQLDYIHLPIVAGQLNMADISAMAKVVNGCDGKVLAFCRTGTRCIYLWALMQSPQMDIEEIIAMAAVAGYDLQSLRGLLNQLRSR
jgi:sulfide:quinone oxidoreductase